MRKDKIVANIIAKRRGPAPGGKATTPMYPEWIIKLVKLRDLKNYTFEEIGVELETSRANACKQFSRWRDWAWKQPQLSNYQKPRKAA
jgi:hypothetical protein